jgi:hypothetical protein
MAGTSVMFGQATLSQFNILFQYVEQRTYQLCIWGGSLVGLLQVLVHLSYLDVSSSTEFAMLWLELA